MDKNLEQAVEQLSKGVAPETVHVLWLTAETLEKTRELSDSYSLEIVDLTPESVERVKKGESTVLQESPVAIDRASLAAVCREILSTLLGKVGKDMDPEVLKMLEGIDWDALVDDHAATLAGTRPQEFLNYIYDNANGADPDTLSRFIFPVLSWALRVFIGNAAKSKAASLDQDSLEDRKYGYKPHCPICGGDPVMARISETNFNGSVRSLVCGTCGASWYWNRIGCPYWETNATRDLRYVHDKDDLDHRLYVCDHCGEILPTVFEHEDEFNRTPDELELVKLGDLQMAYEAGQEKPLN